MLEQKLQDDLKAALLSGDKQKALTLRGLKSVILYAKVASGADREEPMTDDMVIGLFSKEAKKRQESADLYTQGGSADRAAAELAEKAIIMDYLPAQASEADIAKAVDEVIAKTGASCQQAMGQVIGQVKAQLGASADGAVIARLVKEKLA